MSDRFNVDDFIKNAIYAYTIQERTHSSLKLCIYKGKKYVWKKMTPNGPNGEVSADLLIESWQKYVALGDKSNLVQIYAGWWDGSSFNTIMAYLEGYIRVADVSSPMYRERIFTKMCKILASLVVQGVCDYDPDPTNFMFHPETESIVMIDIDKLMVLRNLCADRSHYGSWFSSRMVRMLSWLGGNFEVMEQFTKVEKLG